MFALFSRAILCWALSFRRPGERFEQEFQTHCSFLFQGNIVHPHGDCEIYTVILHTIIMENMAFVCVVVQRWQASVEEAVPQVCGALYKRLTAMRSRVLLGTSSYYLRMPFWFNCERMLPRGRVCSDFVWLLEMGAQTMRVNAFRQQVRDDRWSPRRSHHELRGQQRSQELVHHRRRWHWRSS